MGVGVRAGSTPRAAAVFERELAARPGIVDGAPAVAGAGCCNEAGAGAGPRGGGRARRCTGTTPAPAVTASAGARAATLLALAPPRDLSHRANRPSPRAPRAAPPRAPS